jgi:hypothetical protein
MMFILPPSKLYSPGAILFLLLFGCLQAQCQPPPTGVYQIPVNRACSYVGEQETITIDFNNVEKANSAILSQIEELFISAGFFWNQSSNYVSVINNNDISNCQSFSIPMFLDNPYFGSTRYISYNSRYLDSVKTVTHSMLAITSILAHELAHHLYGHLGDVNKDRHMQELQADYFSGFMMARLKGNKFTMDEASTCLRLFGDSLSTETHPDKATRITYFEDGWKYSRQIDYVTCTQFLDNPETFIEFLQKNKPTFIDSIKKDIKKSIDQEQKDTLSALAKKVEKSMNAALVLRNDSNYYLVNKDNEVAAFDKEGKAIESVDIKLSQPRSAPLRANKHIQKAEVFYENTLFMGKDSLIWDRLPNGIPYIIGIKQKIK